MRLILDLIIVEQTKLYHNKSEERKITFFQLRFYFLKNWILAISEKNFRLFFNLSIWLLYITIDYWFLLIIQSEDACINIHVYTYISQIFKLDFFKIRSQMKKFYFSLLIYFFIQNNFLFDPLISKHHNIYVNLYLFVLNLFVLKINYEYYSNLFLKNQS